MRILVKNLEIMQKKKQIRKQHLAERNALTENMIKKLSATIIQTVKRYLQQQSDLKSRGVYGYYPHGKEVSFMELYTWLLKEQIPLAFPRVSGDTMEFYQVTSMEDFMEGAFHIMEPAENCRQADFEQAFCLVPGTVFDLTGNRYGYGKGYYDRYFDIHKELYRIGAAYNMQVEENIPAEKTDVKMQILVTEKNFWHFTEQ